MSDKPREWPNQAKEARDQAAENLVKIIRTLEPLLEKELCETEIIRRIGIALNCAEKGARILESMGAPTRALE